MDRRSPDERCKENFPSRLGDVEVGWRLDALDKEGHWYAATVVEVNESSRRNDTGAVTHTVRIILLRCSIFLSVSLPKHRPCFARLMYPTPSYPRCPWLAAVLPKSCMYVTGLYCAPWAMIGKDSAG